MGFCAAFGLSGVFKVGTDEEKAGNVKLEEDRRKDRRKAWLMIIVSMLLALLITGVAYWAAR